MKKKIYLEKCFKGRKSIRTISTKPLGIFCKSTLYCLSLWKPELPGKAPLKPKYLAQYLTRYRYKIGKSIVPYCKRKVSYLCDLDITLT